MRRRICLAVGLVALTVPASGWAQSSSQAQYQGVAPETQIPTTGGGGPSAAGGAAVSNANGGGSTTATGSGRPASGGATNASGGTTAGNGATSTGGVGSKAPSISLPPASTSTTPFGGSDILLIVGALAGLAGLGLLLRRSTRTPAGV